MKLKLREITDTYEVVEKEIVHPDNHKLLVEEANERIKNYRDRQYKAIQQAKNYIHDYDNLKRYKGE